MLIGIPDMGWLSWVAEAKASNALLIGRIYLVRTCLLAWVGCYILNKTERCDHSPLSDVFSNQDLVIHLHKVNPRNDCAVRQLMGGVQVRER